ncbi:MAG: hypothetical protein JNN07_04350 [Verrucomicrobiales bacterium]|nr:hypothetical protein [Verrucomicrobiales bacterium]
MSAKRDRKTPGPRRPGVVPLPERAEQLGKLKDQMLGGMLSKTSDPALQARYRWAAEDAAALAFVTPWPNLFFPVLFAEKATEAQLRAKRQSRIKLQCDADPSDKNDSG